jgi:hypothetical protein
MFDWLNTQGRVLWWTISRVYAPFIAIGLPAVIPAPWGGRCLLALRRYSMSRRTDPAGYEAQEGVQFR